MKKPLKSLITMLLVISLLMSNIAMLFTYAALKDYPVELAFNNIFVFEKWANNTISTTVMSFADGTSHANKHGTLSTNIEEGSFRLTKTNMDVSEIYTAFSMDQANAAGNSSYYMMEVEPNTTYTFSYHVEGNIWVFTPFVFFYTAEGLFKGLDTGMVSYGTPGYGNNSFEFTTPADVTGIQIRFTIGDNSTTRPDSSVYADVKDISICKTETVVNPTNLFDFNTWSTKSGSGGGISVYNAGTTSINPDEQSITLTSNGTDNLGGCSSLLTNFSLGVFDNTTFTIDTEPGKKYTLSYNLSATNLASVGNLMALIPWYGSNNSWMSSYGEHGSSALGNNTYTFTVPANVYHFQIVFGLYDYTRTNGVYATVKDIELHEITTVEHKVDPIRKAYTYTAGSNATYGTLPTPSYIPEGYVFAGWYTGKNGDGTHITENTAVHHSSLVVYPKYEPKVDSLAVVTPPAKTTYTVGERFNPTGLVLSATLGDNVFNVTSGYYCTPEYLNTAGEQTITAHYGGKTATFKVNVSEHNNRNLSVNGVAVPVKIANNEYTFTNNDYTSNTPYQAPTPFNRYEITYFSDSYVKGVITMDGTTEEFFLEPSDNGSFASYIDSFLRGINHYTVESIKFTCLDKEHGNFELLSLKTVATEILSDPMQYYENEEYRVGINLEFGGVVSYIEDLKNSPVAAVFNENGKDITKVDFSSKLDTTGAKAISNSVNLINYHDKGRYLQQSYYGTNQPPFEMGDYNGLAWNYNPVQGGNLQSVITGNGGESSKIIDFEITDTQIYIKTRPLDWGKNSVDYPDSFNTPSYMEAWYVFEDGMIKAYCRFVDYSGYPSNTTTQEFPALYTIEPLNNFVYSDGNSLVNVDEPDFWGVLPEYNALLQQNGMLPVDVDVDCPQNWAAFTASPDPDSFGIGVYSPGITDMHYGVFPAIYNEDQVKQGKLVENYRHAASLDPAYESPTSYISPVGVMTFESYKPTEYSFYITTGTAKEIQDDFVAVSNKDVEAEKAKTKIAIPETVYLNPADNKAGQYYVNNDLTDSLSIETVAKRDDTKMQFGVHYDLNKADSFSIKVSNVTDSTNTVTLSGYTAGEKLELDHSGNYINTNYSLSLANAITHNDIAVVKWELTFYKDGAEVETNTAYTVLYAPMRTVGAVSESRRNSNTNNEISSWITGANGVDHQAFSPLGSWKGDIHDSGYFLKDPLFNGPLTSGESQNSHDYIHTDYPNEAGKPNLTDDKGEDAYVVQAATDGEDDSRSQSYLGLLKVDKSRYTNTNQIPNLRIGFDALRVASNENNSLEDYYTMYTLGTSDSFTSTNLHERPSGWTETHYRRPAESNSMPFRTTVIPSYSVSSIDGKYIHAMAHGRCQATQIYKYASAGTSVLCTVTDKGTLRDAVLTGYTITKGDYPENRYNNFIDALEYAATVLGDPSADQATIDLAKKELNDAIEELDGVYYALKYDNIFSLYEFSQHAENMKVTAGGGTATYENGTLKVVNDAITAGEAYTTYGSADKFYKVALKPNTEYVFEYDVNSTVRSQAFMFFYNQNNSNSENPTNMSIKTNNGAWVPKSESNSWWGNYTNEGTYHFTIKFTTGATTTQAGFRFGNTSNDPTTSIFSNIRLVDSAHYYEDVEYSKTEDVFLEDEAYGELMTLTRTGYTFAGWKDANGKTVATTDTAIEHKSIYSQWTEHSYTIIYNSNSGAGSVGNQSIKYTTNVTLASSGFTKTGYVLVGWSVSASATAPDYQLGQTVNRLNGDSNGTITLYAVWQEKLVNITFDNLIDISAWNKVAGNGTVSDITETGFTITSNNGVGEATSSSDYFPVEAGHKYIIEADIVGNSWDIYIFFNTATSTGTGIEFNDSKNRLASNGNNVAEVNGTRYISTEFTAPAGAVRAELRVDANGSDNEVRFENIRVYDISAKTYVSPVNKYVKYQNAYGDLPVPEKEGYEFIGWFNGDNYVTEDTVMTGLETVNLTSKWVVASVVVDFDSPVDINPFDSSASLFTINSVTTNGDSGTFTTDKKTITYTPNKVLDGRDIATYTISFSGTTKTFDILVVPASSVLYNEDKITVSNTTGSKWNVEGTENNIKQTQSDKNDVFGYDEAYNNNIGAFSNGSAYNAVVSSTNNRSQTLTFAYTGSAVDIISACGPTTGIQIISIKNNKGSIEKAYIIDTYYTDTTYLNNQNVLSQVPIVHHENKDGYGTYTVEVTAAYLSSMVNARPFARTLYSANTVNFYSPDVKDMAAEAVLSAIGMEELLDADIEVLFADENSVFNGGTGAVAPAISTFALTRGADRDFSTLNNYFDGFRVYNPLGSADYDYIDSEKGATYYNVINSLASSNDIISGTANSLVAYVEGNTNETIDFADYAGSKAPMNEVYLNNANSGIGFNVEPGYERIMISLRAISGSPKAKIGNKEFAVSSSTEMYYDITDYVQNDTVTVQNTGDGLLAVCNIKVVNGSIMPMMMSALPRMRMMMAAPAEEVVPNQPPVDEPAINPDIVPDSPVENPDLDVEDEIPDTNESEGSIGSIFETLINMIKSFINRVVSFIKTLYTVIGGK